MNNEKIKLGIDAKWYFEGPPSGNMVVKNLVDEIIRNNQDKVSLYLFINKKNKRQALAHFPCAAKLIFLPHMPNLISNLFVLPVAALRHKLNVVLFQNFISIWPGKLYKIAYIHDVLFLDFPQYYTRPELIYFTNMKRLAAKADMIITISDTEKERMINNHVAQGNDIAVVYHGINKNFKPLACYRDEQIKRIAAKYKLPAKYLLFVGRVNIRKNILTLIKSLTLLDDHDIKLLIVGDDGNSNEVLQAYIREKKLGKRIQFTGHVPEQDLHLIYARATVFCFPSYAEGFGLPPLEAMQCGVPVVVSDRTAIPEVCGDAALYINPDDAEDIALKINFLLNNNRFYHEMAGKGIAHAGNFYWERSANEILTLINNAYVNQ